MKNHAVIVFHAYRQLANRALVDIGLAIQIPTFRGCLITSASLLHDLRLTVLSLL